MTIQRLLTDGFFKEGVYLFLGASDTGKTTLISKIAKELAAKRTVAVVDADTGQSHIGPPGTVGWAIVKENENELENLRVEGIAFVGQTSPVGHLLQLTTAIFQCVEQAKSKAKTALIDTPGFVSGAAACAFWWEVVRLLKPRAIIAVNRQNELAEVIQGLAGGGMVIEMIKCDDEVKVKTPEQRRAYRQKRYARYFAAAKTYEIGLKGIAVQTCRKPDNVNVPGLLIGLRDERGADIAMGFVVEWRNGETVVFKSPGLDPKKICCIVVGEAIVDLPI
jgi:polynucleotide 5'-hydroxyl-kinase GRC3/NOL9